MDLFVGIDGGQSSTKCFIGDASGRVLGTGRAGPCNHALAGDGLTRFADAICGSVRKALLAAGLALDSQFVAVCAGLSGGPDDKDSLVRSLLRAQQYRITHDAAIALAGATGGKPGIIVIAGTGSIAFGRNPDGREARAGGWGYIFGDEGSAFDLMRRALRAALQYEEGWGAKTTLLEALLQRCNAANANDLMHRFYSDDYPRDRVASMGPLVDDAAEAGDEVARRILEEAAEWLANTVAGVRRQLFPAGVSVDVRYTGGVFRSETVLGRFRTLVESDQDCRVSAPAFGPAAGALAEAYRLAGMERRLTNVPGEK
jgi:N-acetylglucosamine kinase-like BadF-type ATPase